MKYVKQTGLMVLLIGLLNQYASSPDHPVLIGKGQQPEISVDPAGMVRVTYGKNDSIFCSTSTDNGQTFSQPVRVATLPEMHLGMTRGPRIASSKNFSLITAIDKQGNIHTYRLEHKKKVWKEVAQANDQQGSAPEGLMSLAADDHDNFYAVWLDYRGDKKNKIYFARSTDDGARWGSNQLVYQSPDQTVCECCRPSIAVGHEEVAVMFRNWLQGARDLYLSTSGNGGESFSDAKKLGEGTWKLKGCPMDGGGLIVDDAGKVASVWQREGRIYYAEPSQAERQVGQGRACTIAGSGDNTIIAWQHENQIYISSPTDHQKHVIGQGSFPQLASLKSGRMICVWENEGQIFSRII